jgi:hypothetical protein
VRLLVQLRYDSQQKTLVLGGTKSLTRPAIEYAYDDGGATNSLAACACAPVYVTAGADIVIGWLNY